jgi:hypothetical protein
MEEFTSKEKVKIEGVKIEGVRVIGIVDFYRYGKKGPSIILTVCDFAGHYSFFIPRQVTNC